MTFHPYILQVHSQTHEQLFLNCVVELLVERLKITADQALLALDSPDPQALFFLCQNAALLAQEPFRDKTWAKRWQETRDDVDRLARTAAARLAHAKKRTGESSGHQHPQPLDHAERVIALALFDGLAAAEWCLEIDFASLSLQEKKDRLVESPFRTNA